MNAVCPYCRKNPPAPKPLWPFCSERCKLADLANWVNEGYRIPGQRLPDDEENSSPIADESVEDE